MAELDKALGATNIDPILGKIKAAKTPEDAIGISADIAKGAYEADVRALRAKQEKEKALPAIERKLREEEGTYLRGAQEREQKEISDAETAMQNFKMSKETPFGMAALASTIAVIGQLAGRTGGKQASYNAIRSMTGMMQGYQQGRADIFRREQIEFDKNFKLMQTKIDKARKEFDRAVALMPYNMAKAREVAEVAKAELNSPEVDALIAKQGYVAAQTVLKQASDALQKEADRAQQLKIAEAKKVEAGVKPTAQKAEQFTARRSVDKRIDNAIALLEKPESGVGIKTLLNDQILSRIDPEGITVRSLLASIDADYRFSKGGKALTKNENQILKGVSDWRGKEAGAIITQLKQLKRNMVEDDAIDRETYPVFREMPALGGAAAPGATTAQKVMPTGSKLQAYADTYFNGNINQAKEYLASQGYK